MSDDRNPYFTDHEHPELKESIVAFVDILGYKDFIGVAHGNGTAQSRLTKIHGALSAASHQLNEFNKIGNLLEADLRPKKVEYEIRTFTDTIIIGYPILDDAEMEMGVIFSELSLFQLEMAIRGFFVRGAISIGDLYIDDMAIFGQGLLDAYNGESKDARDPRIILAKSAEEAVQKHLNFYSSPSDSPQARDLYRDADGMFFLNYLESIFGDELHGPNLDILSKHKLAVEAKLIEYRDQPAYWAKYAWSANYHNFFCDQYPSFFGDYKVDLSQFQMKPARIV